MNKYLDKLQRQANQDPFLADFIKPDPSRVTVDYQGKTIGFYTPRKEGEYLRAGALYIDPAYRGKGIMKNTLAAYFSKSKGRAWISDNNHNSIALFTKLGFTPSSIKMMDNEQGKWYIKQ